MPTNQLLLKQWFVLVTAIATGITFGGLLLWFLILYIMPSMHGMGSMHTMMGGMAH